MLHPFRASVQLIGILFVLLAGLWPGSVLAVASDWQKADFSQTRLITGERAEDGSLSAAVELKLEEGWKTYWRSPGDAGFPFVIEVQPEAQNVAGVDIIWPYPYRFVEEWGLEMFGYKQGLVLPLRIEPEDATQPMQLELLLNYAVCSDICINESQTVSLVVPVDAAADSAHVASIEKALAKVPNASGEAGLRIAEAEIAEEGEKNGVLVVTVARDDGSFAQPELFIESNKAGLRFPEAEVETGDGGKQATFRVPYEISVPAKTLEGVEITATLVSKGQAVERELQLTDAAATPSTDTNEEDDPAALIPESGEQEGRPSDEVDASTQEMSPPTQGEQATMPEEEVSLLSMLLIALIGGVILNIMPCVLPVLSIKLLGVAKHGGGNPHEVRLSFAMTALGILVFFLGLALLSITAKTAGEAVGWGFHFQSPTFLAVLSAIILLAAGNLLGLFELQLPEWFNIRIAGPGKPQHHLVGDFVTGLFAALMATPCTAPFMGTAIGFALARSEKEILLIFGFLGLGLALPYLLAVLFPSVVTWLPKPGRWMVHVRRIMGLLMLAAGVWLLWVLTNQVGYRITLAVGGIALAIGLLLHGHMRWALLQRRGILPLLVGGLLFALLSLTNNVMSPSMEINHPTQAEQTVEWVTFDEAEIAGLVAEGKVVFVDITADWCLTCKANKLFVLSKPTIITALSQPGVVAMQGDLTNPDPVIEAYLRANGRFGIPFNIVYGPGAPEGVLLSELLSRDKVLAALKKAAGE